LAVLDIHPELGKRLLALGSVLLHHGVLSARERELLILRSAATRAPYVESGHLPIAGAAGLTPKEIDAIRDPDVDPAGELDERECLLLEACDQLMTVGVLDPSVRARLTHGRDPRELLELTGLVGVYRVIASVTRIYELEPESAPTGAEPARRSVAPPPGR
jgi:alkylhydroperoxidase family enzyme